MPVQTDYLAISWSVSRGLDTYGYNICRLDVRSTDRRHKRMGGGYDMIGAVIGEWLQTAYPERLQALREGRTLEECGYSVKGYTKISEFYGLTFTPDGAPRLDGGCGVSSMERIAEALGISLSRTYSRKGHTTGYMVTDYGSAEAMRAAGR